MSFRCMQAYSVHVPSAEGLAFRCGADDTILSGALRSGISFPYECNSGGCGSCQFELVEGELADLWPDAPGISPRAKQRGRRLACQCVPAGDCTIRVSLDRKNAPPVVPRRQTLTFVSARPLTADMSEFRFHGDTGAEFLPGQYAMMSLPGVTGLRAYSMSNLPNASGEWRFIIKRVPDGKGSALLFNALKPGEAFSIDAPYGNSYLRTGNGRDIVCIAGGSGLSPILSVLHAAVRAPELSAREIRLFYGGRGPEDVCVSDVVSSNPLLQQRVILHTAISDDRAPGAEHWSGERGLVHELVKAELGAQIPAFDYYFCGPAAMTDAVQRMLLLEYKVPANQLHFDRFL